MGECEGLCSRATIMVKGRCQCIGTLQDIKETYGKSYTVTAKLTTVPGGDDVALGEEHPRAKDFGERIRAQFSGAVLQEERGGALVYGVPMGTWSLADLFEFLSSLHKENFVQEYSV